MFGGITHPNMKRKKLLFVVIPLCFLALVVACLLSALLATSTAIRGAVAPSSGQLSVCQIRWTFTDVAVDRFVRIGGGSQQPIHEFLARLQPLPSVVNGAFINSTNGSSYYRLTELLATNGMGRLPMFGGERVLFVHATQ